MSGLVNMKPNRLKMKKNLIIYRAPSNFNIKSWRFMDMPRSFFILGYKGHMHTYFLYNTQGRIVFLKNER